MSPTRPYGPSNWQEQPWGTKEGRVANDDGAEILVVQIAQPLDLIREQAKKALESGEVSPDSFFGLADRLREFNYGRDIETRDEFNQFLADKKDLIRSGLEAFASIPRIDVIRLNGHARIEGDPKDVSARFLQAIEHENYKATGENDYTWQEVYSVMEVGAQFSDEQNRRVA